MTEQGNRLSPKVIDRLFGRMLAKYGDKWSGMWSGIDPEAVKDEWAEELSCYTKTLDAIAHGLDNLPHDIPPSLDEFKALCVKPGEVQQASKEPEVPVQGARVIGKPTPSEWMAQLDRDVRAGTASLARKRHHQIAIENGYFGGGTSAGGEFTSISADVLPAGMRDQQ